MAEVESLLIIAGELVCELRVREVSPMETLFQDVRYGVRVPRMIGSPART